MQAERIKILQQIDELDKQRCNLCTAHLNKLEATCECYAAVKIRELGRVIIKLTKPRNVHEFELLERVGFENLTVDVYRQVSEQGLKVTDIAKALNTDRATLYNWRRDNGLLDKRSVEV